MKSDSFRPFSTIVAPGAVAISPFFIVLGYYVSAVTSFWTEHETAFGLMAALAILLTGFVLEEIGSLIEEVWDQRLVKRDSSHAIIWRVYLQLKLKNEMVGQRYLRDVLTRLKFELAMTPALLLCLVGLLWINGLYGVWSSCAMTLIALTILILAGFLLWESFQSAELLSRTRGAIVTAMRLDSAADLFEPLLTAKADEAVAASKRVAD